MRTSQISLERKAKPGKLSNLSEILQAMDKTRIPNPPRKPPNTVTRTIVKTALPITEKTTLGLKHHSMPKQFMDSSSLSGGPGNGSKVSSEFVRAYDEGLIPCRIWHGAAHKLLKWDRELSETEPKKLANLLISFTSGLMHDTYPYNWIVEHGLDDVLKFMTCTPNTQGYLLSEVDGRRIALDLRKALSSPTSAANVPSHLKLYVQALHPANLEQIISSIVTPLSKLKSKMAESAKQHPQSNKIKDKNFSRSSSTSGDPWSKISEDISGFRSALEEKCPALVPLIKQKWPTFGSD